MDTKLYVYSHYQNLLVLAARAGNDIYQNEINKLSNLPHLRKLFSNNVSIKDIFIEYWDEFKSRFFDRLRPSIIDNVEKMINCHNLKNGYLFYECPNCDNYHITGFSCHSRFCPSCSHKYKESRSIQISKKLINCPHRHFTFSIPKEMRSYFWKYRGLFDILFLSVNEALTNTIRKSNKDVSLDKRLGIIAFQHSYGRDAKTNPHIHALVAERTLDINNNLKFMNYFHYEKLRKYWQFILLKNVSFYLKVHGSKDDYYEFNKLRSFLAKKYLDGFYAHGPQVKENTSLSSSKKVTDYIIRYASHPAISESRIISFDKTNHTVTFYYDPHEDEKTLDTSKKKGRQFITEHVFKFIIRLIRHIPDKGFHLIRYYGFYSNRTTKSIAGVNKLFPCNHINYLKNSLKWRILIMNTYKYDPILCACGSKMKLNFYLSYLPNHTKEYISDA